MAKAPKALRPTDLDFKLNFVLSGEPIPVEAVADLYGIFRRHHLKKSITEASDEDDGDEAPPARKKAEPHVIFADAAQKSGSHILKMLSKKASDHVLHFPIPNGGMARRLYPSMNAADGPYSKVIFQPIAIEGTPGAKSLVDHIITPDDNTEKMFASFVAAFSQEALDAVREGILRPKRHVLTLHEDMPLVYVPDGKGGDLQLTPIGPMDAFNRFREEVALAKGVKMNTPIVDLEVSSKMQNISVAVGGMRRRFLAIVPPALRPTEAGIWRFAQGGRPPVIPGSEISELLEGLADLDASRLEKTQDGIHSARRNLEGGEERLALWILREAQDWIDHVEAKFREINPEADPPVIDVEKLLLASYRGTKFEQVRKAVKGEVFQAVLEEEGV